MSESHSLSGSIKQIDETQTFLSGFTKREFVVTVPDGNYPQDIKLEVVKDRCAELDALSVGQEVAISFNLRGNEHNGRHFVNLQAWKINANQMQQPAPPQTGADVIDEAMPF